MESFDRQFSEVAAPGIHVDELMALSTPDFVKYMRQNMGPTGEIVFTAVDGWDLLSKEQREALRQKTLKAVEVLELEDSNASQIGPVDANQLTTLLEKAQQGRSEPERDDDGEWDRRSRETLSPEPTTVLQTRWYDQLVRDGGRPLYSLEQLDRIASNPSLHQSLLQPWADNPETPQPDDWEVFSKQLESWWAFRRWQRDNRNWSSFDEDTELAFYVEERKKYFKLEGYGNTEEAKFEATLRSMWASIYRKKRLTERKREWETRGDKTFEGYVKAAKQRLEEHGFTEPFHLHQDARLQDEWTTWVEYIEYNCWLLDKDIQTVERLQIRHDAEWKRVQEAGVLNEGETAESVCTKAAGSALHMELVRAAEGLDRMREIFNRSKGGSDTTPGTEHSVKPKSLQQAEEIYETAEKRVGLLRDFRDKVEPYRVRKARIPHRRALIPWLVEQASQIRKEQERRRQQQELQQQVEEPRTAVAAKGRNKRTRSEADQGGQELALNEAGAKRTKRHKETRSSPSGADQTSASIAADEQGTAVPRPSTSRRKAKTAAEPTQPSPSSSTSLDKTNSGQIATRRTRNEWMSSLRKRPSQATPVPDLRLPRKAQRAPQQSRTQAVREKKTAAAAAAREKRKSIAATSGRKMKTAASRKRTGSGKNTKAKEGT